MFAMLAQAKRDWKEMESKKDDIRRLSSKCVGLKALLLQHAPGNQVSLVCTNAFFFFFRRAHGIFSVQGRLFNH